MNLCSHTPNLSVFDSRGLPVRQVGFYRADVQDRPELRMTRQAFDALGRLLATTDPRLDRPSTSTVFSLSGQPLLTENVDAGWRLTLLGEAGQALESHDSRGALSSVEYDKMMRPLAMAETLDGEAARVSDRFIYGDASAPGTAHNQCGRLLRRDDPAGSVGFSAYALTGAVLHQERRFLAQAGSVDWPQEPSHRDLLLEAQRYLSTSRASASGEVIEQTDAQENRRILTYACSGELTSTALRSSGSDKMHVLVSDIRYHAMGAAEREVAGNGVISRYAYDEADGRLTRLLALSPAGQALQDLNYVYDPVGNVVSVEDAAQAVSFFKNQRVDPINRYVYDSFYQLIEATGREVAPASHLPGLPGLHPLPLDPGNLINYTQCFEYDAGANLLARHHSGTETWRMAVSSTSNRSLPQRADGTLPDQGQIAEAFDGNGNLKALQPGQAMTWDARNQLSEVTAVKREDGPDDSELYRYDGKGQRVQKVRMSQTRSRTLTAEVRYLPGLEIHRNEATGEVQHVLTVEAGRSSVRLLHWESGKPDGIENDQLRYSLSDHLGSSTLELDQDAKLISHEGYYPFGGTAWWAARSAVEANYKTVRYSGKERDATGLYYYGFRYYAPWSQRWVNPDPAGDADGLNRYRMVKNNPVTTWDIDGLRPPQTEAEAWIVALHTLNGTTDELPKDLRARGVLESEGALGEFGDTAQIGNYHEIKRPVDELMKRMASEQWPESLKGTASKYAAQHLKLPPTGGGTVFRHKQIVIKSMMAGAKQAILVAHGGISPHQRRFKDPIHLPADKTVVYYSKHMLDSSSGVAKRLAMHASTYDANAVEPAPKNYIPAEIVAGGGETFNYRLSNTSEGDLLNPNEAFDIIHVAHGDSALLAEVFDALGVYRNEVSTVHAVFCRAVFDRSRKRIYPVSRISSGADH